MEIGSNEKNPPATSLGYSVGRWEGRTLIVRTEDINYPYLDDLGTPQSEAVEIVERFTLSEDETRLDWVATVVVQSVLFFPFRPNRTKTVQEVPGPGSSIPTFITTGSKLIAT